MRNSTREPAALSQITAEQGRAVQQRVRNAPICWDLGRFNRLYEILQTMGWINKDLPTWIGSFDPVEDTLASIRGRLSKE